MYAFDKFLGSNGHVKKILQLLFKAITTGWNSRQQQFGKGILSC